MHEVPYVTFPKVTSGAYELFRSQGDCCIREGSGGSHVGLRIRTNAADAPITLLVFEPGATGAAAFTRWCEQNRERFGTSIASLTLVPHRNLEPAPEYVDE